MRTAREERIACALEFAESLSDRSARLNHGGTWVLRHPHLDDEDDDLPPPWEDRDDD